MGYCFYTGRKENGKWKFSECDGRRGKEAESCTEGEDLPRDGARNSECAKFSHTYEQAVAEIEEWHRVNHIPILDLKDIDDEDEIHQDHFP